MSLPLMLHLYMACVQPAGCYGCELWGCLTMSAGHKRERQAIATDFLARLKQVAGMRVCVPTAVVHKELQIAPLEHTYLERQLTFWNNVVLLTPDNLFRKIMLDACYDAVNGKVHNWVWCFHRALEKQGYTVCHNSRSLFLKDKPCLKALLHEHLHHPFQGIDISPRLCDSAGAVSCTYMNWFSKPDWPCQNFLTAPVHISLMRLFIRFRTGCHQLPIVSGRLSRIPRSQRLCSACNTSSIGDEMHMIFECPALENLRQKYSHLFHSHVTTMQQFMWQNETIQVMLFIRDCLSQIVV